MILTRYYFLLVDLSSCLHSAQQTTLAKCQISLLPEGQMHFLAQTSEDNLIPLMDYDSKLIIWVHVMYPHSYR